MQDCKVAVHRFVLLALFSGLRLALGLNESSFVVPEATLHVQDADISLPRNTCEVFNYPLAVFELLIKAQSLELFDDSFAFNRHVFGYKLYPPYVTTRGYPERRYSCRLTSAPTRNEGVVHVVNSTLEGFFNSTTMPCRLINFYSRYCPFSAQLAPWFNVLPLQFPYLMVAAVEVNEITSHNARYGITGTPSVLLFYYQKPVARYNYTVYSLSLLESFITRHTDCVSAARTLDSFSELDYSDPLPITPEPLYDVWLTIAWVFVFFATAYYGIFEGYFLKSIAFFRRKLQRRR